MRIGDQEKYSDGSVAKQMVERFFQRASSEELDALVSGENISTFTEEGLGRLYSCAMEYFDRVVVIAFIRPPKSFINSATVQRVQGGNSLRSLCEKPALPRYRPRFHKFLTLFGRENVRFKIFSSSLLLDGCPFQTLLSQIDRDLSALAEERAPQLNMSFSILAVKALSSFIDANPDIPIQSYLEKIVPTLSTLEGARFLLPTEVMKAAEYRMEQDVRWMESVLGQPLSPWDSPPHSISASVASLFSFDASEVGSIIRCMTRVV